jgi:hypothetical protein
MNDGGTMVQVAVTDLAAYFDDEITAMPNLTSVGTLTALTVDDVAVDGKVITMTGSSGDTFVTTVAANGATSLVTTDASAAAAHLTITADGTVDINSAGVLTLDSGAAINIEPAAGSAILLDGTISVDAGVVTGATSVTSTAFVGNLTGTVATATQNSITTMTGLVTTGALGTGSIAAGFGAIDNGASNIRTGGHVHLDVDADADDITGDSATGRISLGAGEDLNLYHGGTNSYIVNGTGNLIINSYASDSDIIFSGNDAGDPITALTFDMSDAGVAKFNRGILFHNDTAAANELDDYEEGTWTPSLQVAPSGVSIQSGSVVANYTKIGNRVCISMVMNLASSNNPGSNTDMRIAGFPFSNADSSVTHPANLHANHKPTPQLHINGSGYLYYQNTTEGGNNQNPIGLGLDAVSVLGLSFQYRTTS